MNVFLRKSLLGAFLMLMTWTISTAQVSLILPTVNVDSGDEISLDVKITNFTDVVSMQFTLEWDSTVLNFSSVSNFNLPEFNSSNFNTINGSKLALLWIDNSLQGVTHPDSTAVFRLTFDVVGEGNQTTPIAYTSNPTIIEVGGLVNGDTELLEFTLVHGLVNVNGPNAIATHSQEYFSLGQNFPNPFKDFTYIPFNLTHSAELSLAIYNNYGQIIYREDNFFLAGKHSLKINSDILPSTGIYTIKLFTSDFLATKQLIFLN